MPDSVQPIAPIRACHCCGLAQHVPLAVPGTNARIDARCSRCHTRFSNADGRSRRNGWAAGAALASLILYPLGIGLPVLEVERFGHARASSIWNGALALIEEREWVVGLAVLICSVIFPAVKLLGLLALTTAPRLFGASRLRARVWRSIEWVGRWGMLDVLLVAVLIATLKLGDLVEVHPGPGLLAFTAMVAASLAAGALFDPHALWATSEFKAEPESDHSPHVSPAS